ncbi:HAD-IA family hydrolase [Rhodobacteraceae bacterium MCCB 386]|nr:HAD-IA family hydrolase [Roseitranquillus sediminis]MBM9596352.1 HAD-IA family hydrolase [Roseitranquillus sediminis]
MRLIVFDVDGTLVDSQRQIAAAYTAGFAAIDRPAPRLAEVRSVIGLSLPLAFTRLAPDATPGEVERGILAYRRAFSAGPEAPLFPGIAEMLRRLGSRPTTLLRIATGKSRRGVDRLLAHHALEGLFQTVQTADLHPSKPHPAMLTAALDAVGVTPEHAVIVGDATFDVEMGRAAGIGALGVAWGYHPAAALHGAGAIGVAEDVAALEAMLGAGEMAVA